MVWQGVVQSLAPLLGGAVFLFWHHRQSAEASDTDWRTPIGANGVRLAVAFSLMMWMLPGGLVLGLPICVLLCIVSPAARLEWRDYGKVRLKAVAVALICLCLSGLLPTQAPVSPTQWGNPIFTHNPHAPFYPASQQYTWVTTDVAVLQSVSLRLPYQTGVQNAEWTAMAMASIFGLHTARMEQAIQLIDDELPFRLNPDDILLEAVPSPHSIDVRVSSEKTTTLEFRRYDIKTTAIGLDAAGTKVGEVVVASQAMWGGQLNMLIIVRPIGHDSFDEDSRGENWMRDWLLAQDTA